MEVNAADYIEFPKDTVTRKRPPASPVAARAQHGASRPLRRRERIPESDRFSRAGIACRVYSQLELVASRWRMSDFRVGMRTLPDFKEPWSVNTGRRLDILNVFAQGVRVYRAIV